ncbi:MAG: 50S ribosomal protein L23 [Candidatus Saccharimonadales bacterium]
MYKQLILRPVMSEKAYAQSMTKNTYVFEVPGEVNKHSVARAVEQQFDVRVAGVNITNIPGKAKRTVYKGGKAVKGRESDTKKAYVTLVEGNSLPIFAAIEEEEAKVEATQEKLDKAAAKVADKEAKKAKKETK